MGKLHGGSVGVAVAGDDFQAQALALDGHLLAQFTGPQKQDFGRPRRQSCTEHMLTPSARPEKQTMIAANARRATGEAAKAGTALVRFLGLSQALSPRCLLGQGGLDLLQHRVYIGAVQVFLRLAAESGFRQ